MDDSLAVCPNDKIHLKLTKLLPLSGFNFKNQSNQLVRKAKKIAKHILAGERMYNYKFYFIFLSINYVYLFICLAYNNTNKLKKYNTNFQIGFCLM